MSVREREEKKNEGKKNTEVIERRKKARKRETERLRKIKRERGGRDR